MTATHNMSEDRARRLYAALTTPRLADPDFTLADAEGLVWCRTFEEFVLENNICLQDNPMNDSPTMREVNARRGCR